MTAKIDALEDVRIESPCTVPWNSMKGDERVRHCAHCRLSVYNLSAMSRDEALKLVQGTEGRLCVRMLRRPDGTVVTKNCGAARRWVRARVATVAAVLGGLLALVSLGFAHSGRTSGEVAADFRDRIVGIRPPRVMSSPPAIWLRQKLGLMPAPATMGVVCIPSPAPAPAPSGASAAVPPAAAS